MSAHWDPSTFLKAFWGGQPSLQCIHREAAARHMLRAGAVQAPSCALLVVHPTVTPHEDLSSVSIMQSGSWASPNGCLSRSHYWRTWPSRARYSQTRLREVIPCSHIGCRPHACDVCRALSKEDVNQPVSMADFKQVPALCMQHYRSCCANATVEQIGIFHQLCPQWPSMAALQLQLPRTAVDVD